MLTRSNPRGRVLNAIAAAAFIFFAVPGAAHAALVVAEQFVYGNTAGSLAGNAGGTGFGGAWTGASQFSYTPTGLTFGTLETSGGAAVYTSNQANLTTSASRAFASPLSNTTYGSFLFRIDSRVGSVNNMGVLLASSAAQNDGTAPLALSLPVNTTNGPGRAQLQFQDPNGSSAFVSGAASQLSVGTVYMALFKYTASANSAATKLWLLTGDQYDDFVVGGLTESELDSAIIGATAANVWGRLSLSASVTPGSRGFLSLFGFTGTAGSQSLVETVDEFRLGNASLNDVAPQAQTLDVPEPGALALSALGLSLAAAATRRRRQPA